MKLIAPCNDFLEHFVMIFAFEWEPAVKHGVEDDAGTPGINLLAVVGMLLQDLWRRVVR